MASESTVLKEISRPVDLTRWAKGLLRFARQKPLGTFGAVVILIFLLAAAFADVVAPYRFDDFDIPGRFSAPSIHHFFGTDDQGRDVFSRIIYGARTSVFTGFGVVAITTVLATTIGIISGYYGGLVDLIMQRLVDVWMSFPALVFLILFASIVGTSILTLTLVISVLFVARSSRVIRSATLTIKENTYVDAARVLGCRDMRIVLRHILPNVVPIILITASIQIGAVILIESSLSFLGYGIPPPFPSWGRMLNESRLDMINHPYLALFPGAAIALTVYAFNMFGDALRDVLDPRMRGSS